MIHNGLHFTTNWSKEDMVFIARCEEYESLTTDGNTRKGALDNLKELIMDILSEESDG